MASAPLVFVSYSREDQAYAEKLSDSLTQHGVRVWFDKKNLLPGVRWKEEVKNAIGECDFFLTLMSSNSVNKRGFVQSEVALALDFLQQCPESNIFVIPARLEDVIPSHSRLRDLHWVDLFPSWEQGMLSILSVLVGVEAAKTGPISMPTDTSELLSDAQLCGVYSVAGSNGQVPYRGELQITKMNNFYSGAWIIGGGRQAISGIGILARNVLSFSFHYENEDGELRNGIVAYEIIDRGSIRGRWIEFGTSKLGFEECRKTDKTHLSCESWYMEDDDRSF